MNHIRYANIVNEYQHLSYDAVVEISKDKRLPCSLMMFNVRTNRNIGALIRTAEIFGCSDVYLIGDQKVDMRSSQGAHNYLTLHKTRADIEDENDLVAKFNETIETNNLMPVFVEQGGKELDEIDWTYYFNKKVCFVVGNESIGIPNQLLTKNSTIVSIGQIGVGRSLNVAVARGILMHHFAKQYKK